MSKVLDLLKREPVRIYSGVLAVLALVGAFGVDLSAEQRAAIVGVAAVALGAGSQVVRARVTPWAPVAEPEPPPEPPSAN